MAEEKKKKGLYLGCHHGFQILGHFAIRNGRHFLARNINQTANLGATNRIEQDGGRISQNNMSMICIWKITVL